MKNLILATATFLLAAQAFADNGQRCYEALNPEVVSITNTKPAITENAISGKIHTFTKAYIAAKYPGGEGSEVVHAQFKTKSFLYETGGTVPYDKKNVYQVDCDGGSVEIKKTAKGNLIANSDYLSGMTFSSFGCSTGQAKFQNLILEEVKCTSESIDTIKLPENEEEPAS